MRYIGNKTKLLDFIHGEIQSVCGDISTSKFCDLFSGSGSVARYFKQHCAEVIANDLEDYSYVLSHKIRQNNIDRFLIYLLKKNKFFLGYLRTRGTFFTRGSLLSIK